MPKTTFADWLTRAIEAELDRNPAPARAAPGRAGFAAAAGAARMIGATGGRARDAGLAQTIAQQLVGEALASGLLDAREDISDEALSGGNTAERVGLLGLRLPFVFKMDSNTPKLAAEGATIRAIRADDRLPTEFREAWPTIYALRRQTPFAYLMEYFPREEGWASLEDRLYPKPGVATQPVDRHEALRLTMRVLDVLFAGYDASVDRRFLPNIEIDYLDRIAGRLRDAAKVDPRFRSCPVRVGDRRFEPWETSLRRLFDRPDLIRAVTPPFRTVVHGDPNPGNLLLKTSVGAAEVKLIDPKEWGAGDYLFDVAKITHFLLGTGPVEKPSSGRPCAPRVTEDGGGLLVEYEIERPAWTEDLVHLCLARTESFAAAHGDRAWKTRYALAMASNLLGLPIGRLTHSRNPRPDAAMALYCEGLRWLDEACALLGLTRGGAAS